MRLILTEYINSLKEDGELDKLIQDILRAYQIEIFSSPEKGRQYGVDIYAVGKDFEDGNKKKVFLITVKQGDLDRQNWNVHQNSVQQSIDEIRTVFVRNNLASQHKKLPVKIVVAFNGTLKQSVQQNWRGYADANPGFEYALWEIDFLVNNFQNKLLNEHGFSNEVRSLIRKTIIHLENPFYDLADYTKLLETIFDQFKLASSKKAKLKLLKELHLIVAIIIKYSAEANNLKHAIKCSEKYILRLWHELSPFDSEKEYIHAIIAGYNIVLETYLSYYKKIGFIGHIKDGFSRSANDSLTYNYTIYEQVGILSMCGLSILQMHEIIYKIENISQFVDELKKSSLEIADTIICTFNNNPIIYSPRADDQHIEICLAFIFLYKLDRKNDIKTLLRLYNQQIGEGKIFSNIFPEFSNHRKVIAELEVDIDKRMEYDYQASNLFTVLIEWTAVLRDKGLYNMYKLLKDQLLSEMDLLLWFPEENTEEMLYTKYATLESGYALSGIKLPNDFEEFCNTIFKEYSNNANEKEFGFIKQGIWAIGLIASRHYRTYIFPHYWRQFLEDEAVTLNEKA
ncbi:hypothetical protein [Pedobacter terrae]|uniref:hypothetical protein n=1 Tax=Pedobacter terrae TaxID=405671 RepID=UPI002FFCDF83